MTNIIYPPFSGVTDNKYKIFLAGSINMGESADWQSDTADKLRRQIDPDITIYNPRRPDWDNLIIQEFIDPKFSQQVNWELNNLDRSEYILFYFDKQGASPISLMELGLYAHYNNNGKFITVVCEDGFWRKGNIDIVCDRYNILQIKDLDLAINTIAQKIYYEQTK